MKKRQYLLLRAWLTVGITIFFISLMVFGNIDRSMLWFGALFIAVSAFTAYTYFKKASATGDEEVIHAPPPNANDTELVRFHKRTLILCLVIFPLLTLLVVYNLHSIAAGETQSNELADIVSVLYTNFGYWPTLAVVPVFGAICVLINLRKIQVLKSKS